MSNLICDLCPRYCKIKKNEVGFCKTRKNDGSRIISLNYGKILALGLDPIEKKPLNFFCPGSNILSVGSFGCNMACEFCQNHEISRAGLKDYPFEEVSPERLINIAKNYEKDGNIGIAFTYNEPLLNYEYILDTAKLASEEELRIVLVSNGQINDRYLQKLLPFVDAWNIDLKAFSEDKYRKMGGDLKTVLNTIRKTTEKSHVEITTLIVPGISDNLEEFVREVEFLASLDRDIPLHITRYFPRYKYTEPPTDIELMIYFEKIAEKYLNRVILGNI